MPSWLEISLIFFARLVNPSTAPLSKCLIVDLRAAGELEDLVAEEELVAEAGAAEANPAALCHH